MFSLYAGLLTFGPVFTKEIEYRFKNLRNISYVVADSNGQIDTESLLYTPTPPVETPKPLPSDKLEVLRPVDINFGIVIPKIGANSKIISNVDTSNYSSYIEALKQGVAHAAGTYFPGQGHKIYLFAHSTDTFWNVSTYNAVFYLLKEVEVDDEIVIFFGGRRYNYLVSDKKIVESSDVHYITEPSDEEVLLLQTCYPPGTTLKRLIIFAKPQK